MANTDNIVSFVANSAITEYALVSVLATGKIQVTASEDETNCVGIAQRACSAGDSVEVLVLGKSRAIAGGAITPATMNLLMATADGKLVAFDEAAGSYAVARMLPNINQVSASSGDQINVIFTGPVAITAS
jgi:hypothetical protein